MPSVLKKLIIEVGEAVGNYQFMYYILTDSLLCAKIWHGAVMQQDWMAGALPWRPWIYRDRCLGRTEAGVYVGMEGGGREAFQTHKHDKGEGVWEFVKDSLRMDQH